MEAGWTTEKPSGETGWRGNLGHISSSACFNYLEGRANMTT